MNIPALMLTTAASFLFLVLVFRPLELAFPARRGQRFLRPAWWTDLCFFLGQYLLWGGVVFWPLSWFGGWVAAAVVPATFRRAVAGQPWLLQAAEVVLLSDFLIYWG